MGLDFLDRPLQNHFVALTILVFGAHRVRQVHHRALAPQVVGLHPIKDVDDFRLVDDAECIGNQCHRDLSFDSSSGSGGVFVEPPRPNTDLQDSLSLKLFRIFALVVFIPGVDEDNLGISGNVELAVAVLAQKRDGSGFVRVRTTVSDKFMELLQVLLLLPCM